MGVRWCCGAYSIEHTQGGRTTDWMVVGGIRRFFSASSCWMNSYVLSARTLSEGKGNNNNNNNYSYNNINNHNNNRVRRYLKAVLLPMIVHGLLQPMLPGGARIICMIYLARAPWGWSVIWMSYLLIAQALATAGEVRKCGTVDHDTAEVCRHFELCRRRCIGFLCLFPGGVLFKGILSDQR